MSSSPLLASIAGLTVGKGSTVKVMGIINASPESFYKGSVRTTESEIVETARQMQENGASIIDIGAMSTAPYLDTMVSKEEEIHRMNAAIKAVKEGCKNMAVSADTPRAQVAKEAIMAGADIINDVTGLKYDDEMANIISKARVPVIVGAYRKSNAKGATSDTIAALKESIAIAKKAKIDISKIIVDPSIGFFREDGKNPFFSQMADMPWYARDLEVLSNLKSLESLKRPICVSVSRKSFIGYLLNLEVEDRMAASVACETLAVQNGANIIRTHNVKETVQGIMMHELLSSHSRQSGKDASKRL